MWRPGGGGGRGMTTRRQQSSNAELRKASSCEQSHDAIALRRTLGNSPQSELADQWYNQEAEVPIQAQVTVTTSLNTGDAEHT